MATIIKKSDGAHFSYDNHETVWEEILNEPNGRELAETWLRSDTLDHWRHHKIRSPIDPLAVFDKAANWLTLGDGRFGGDAHYLLSLGVQSVHSSDISDALLKVAKVEGYINEFSVVNAEDIGFPDSSFDYVYCKESLHHCPRPYIALHEMFRVAKKAVVIAEPWDEFADKPPFYFVLRILRKILGKKNVDHGFETIGNYVHGVTPRELEKFLLGMHYTKVAFFSVNDAYIPGVEYASIQSKNLTDVIIKCKLLGKIFILDILCCLGIKKPTILISILFKSEPSEDLLASLRGIGWRYKELPKNPYLTK